MQFSKIQRLGSVLGLVGILGLNPTIAKAEHSTDRAFLERLHGGSHRLVISFFLQGQDLGYKLYSFRGASDDTESELVSYDKSTRRYGDKLRCTIYRDNLLVAHVGSPDECKRVYNIAMGIMQRALGRR